MVALAARSSLSGRRIRRFGSCALSAVGKNRVGRNGQGPGGIGNDAQVAIDASEKMKGAYKTLGDRGAEGKAAEISR